jgi:exonuclease VII small subunit
MEREVDRIISTLEKGEEFLEDSVDHFDLLDVVSYVERI